tara:strand:- start:735 stop:1406 length:672 start_codon:yes stop_codon:yes gene_type:complete
MVTFLCSVFSPIYLRVHYYLANKLSSKYDDELIVFYDLETTGLNPYHSRITEIAMMVYSVNKGCIVDTYSSLVDPEISVPPKITKITGITDEMVRGKHTVDEIITDVILRCGLATHRDVYFVAHNNDGFDKLFMRRYLRNRKEIRANVIHLDTMRFAQKLLPELNRFSLRELCKHFHIEQEGAHRALADTVSVRSLYRSLCDAYLQVTDGKISPRDVYDYIYN